jgi:hypothetical protein
MMQGPKDEIDERLLGVVDRVFLVIFSRYRRKLGDADVDAAWRNASNQVSGYLVLPAATVVFVLLAIIESFSEDGLNTGHKRAWQILAAVFWLLIAVLLDRRFRKFLSNQPRLTAEETLEEKSLVLRFRAVAIGTFVLACLVVIAAYEFRIGM